MRKSLLLPLAPLLLAGCTGTDVAVGLGARVGMPQATAAAAPTGEVATVRQQVVLANGLEVERVRLVVRELKLEGVGGDDDSTDDDGSGEDGGSRRGPSSSISRVPVSRASSCRCRGSRYRRGYDLN